MFSVIFLKKVKGLEFQNTLSKSVKVLIWILNFRGVDKYLLAANSFPTSETGSPQSIPWVRIWKPQYWLTKIWTLTSLPAPKRGTPLFWRNFILFQICCGPENGKLAWVDKEAPSPMNLLPFVLRKLCVLLPQPIRFNETKMISSQNLVETSSPHWPLAHLKASMSLPKADPRIQGPRSKDQARTWPNYWSLRLNCPAFSSVSSIRTITAAALLPIRKRRAYASFGTVSFFWKIWSRPRTYVKHKMTLTHLWAKHKKRFRWGKLKIRWLLFVWLT